MVQNKSRPVLYCKQKQANKGNLSLLVAVAMAHAIAHELLFL